MDAAQDMSPEEEKDFYYAIVHYIFNGEIPTFDTPIARSVFTAIRPGLDSNVKRSKSAKTAAEARWKEKNNASH